MTSKFTYTVTVTSEEEITPRITGGIIRLILKNNYKHGKCEVDLTGYSGSNSKDDVKIAIVGSRRRNSDKDDFDVRETVRELYREYKDRLVIVSGGCWGVDTWAEDEARKVGIPDNRIKIFKPDFEHVTLYSEAVAAYHKRNKEIAEYATHGIIVFVSSDRTGGTENTIKHAQKLNRSITIK